MQWCTFAPVKLIYNLYRTLPSSQKELCDQIYSEILGGPGGVCALRLRAEQQLSKPDSAGFYYDDSDSCWRCNGNNVFEEAAFVDHNSRFMLPPVALDNDKAWKLSPSYAEWLPREIHLSGDIFCLAGVTMYEKDHFTSLILVGGKWHFYDGLQGEGVLKAIDSVGIASLKSFLCNAYYLLE